MVSALARRRGARRRRASVHPGVVRADLRRRWRSLDYGGRADPACPLQPDHTEGRSVGGSLRATGRPRSRAAVRVFLRARRSVHRGHVPVRRARLAAAARPAGCVLLDACTTTMPRSAVVTALNLASGIYNVVDNEPMTHRQLGEVAGGDARRANAEDSASMAGAADRRPGRDDVAVAQDLEREAPATGRLGAAARDLARGMGGRLSVVQVRSSGITDIEDCCLAGTPIASRPSIGAIMRPPHARGGGRKEQAS